MQNPFDILNERFDRLEERLFANQHQSQKQSPEIINREELCRRLDITEPTIIRWEKRGKIPSIRIGGSVRYNWTAVIEALEQKGGSKQ